MRGPHNSRMPTLRLGFVLLSPSSAPQPSTRVSVLNMLPYLRDAGIDARIAHQPSRDDERPDLSHLDAQQLARQFDLVYFQKVHGPSAVALARRLRAAGVGTLYGNCDLVEPEMTAATDASVVATEFLKSLQPAELHERIHVVHDGIENPGACKTAYGDGRGSALRPLRAVLVTSQPLTQLPVLRVPPPWMRIAIVGRYAPAGQRLERLRQIRWQMAREPQRHVARTLSFLAHPRIERVTWTPAGVYEELLRADIGIIPIETRTGGDADTGIMPAWKIKTENRLTLKMSAGLPVVATPIPAYEAVLADGVDGFFARTREEWLDRLAALRDPALRATVGTRARERVTARYSKEAQARALIDVLRRLAQQIGHERVAV